MLLPRKACSRRIQTSVQLFTFGLRACYESDQKPNLPQTYPRFGTLTLAYLKTRKDTLSHGFHRPGLSSWPLCCCCLSLDWKLKQVEYTQMCEQVPPSGRVPRSTAPPEATDNHELKVALPAKPHGCVGFMTVTRFCQAFLAELQQSPAQMLCGMWQSMKR